MMSLSTLATGWRGATSKSMNRKERRKQGSHDLNAMMARGNALLEAGKSEQAIAVYRSIIAAQPNSPGAWSNIGTVLVNLGQLEEGIKAHRKSVALKPDFAVGHFNLGNALLRAGHLEDSVESLKKVIDLKPDMAQAHNDLGNVYYMLGQRELAIACYRRAILIDPNFAEAYSNLANPLTDNMQLDEAMAMTLRSIQINPARPEAHSNFGNVLVAADKVKEAIGPYRHALSLNPDYAEAHSNLGHVFGRMGAWDESAAAFRAAIAAKPDYAEAHLYHAMILLRRGALEPGWREYEWRWKIHPHSGDRIVSDAPEWQGEDLNGKTIVLYAEQGLGDTIQFARYATLLAARGAKVVLAVQAALVRTMRTVPGVAEVVALTDSLPPIDYHLPLMSAPRLVGPTLADIPGTVPYLSANPEKWRARLAGLPGLKVGIVWAGAARAHDRAASHTDRRRSLALQQLAPLFDVPGVSFINLQKGEPAAQMKEAAYPIADFMDEMKDFADTADLVAALDLVITVDTSVAHLAGALAVPVWILSRFDGCWRWLEEGDTTPWYPTMRLFRQTAPGEWGDVVGQVVGALAPGK